MCGKRTGKQSRMALSPEVPPSATGSPWYRRYWGYAGRPYAGCGCLYLLIVVVLIWGLLALLFAPLRVY